ncbi:glycosyltransferase [Acuticoccus sp. MNP-M23]|uniref:glycosyltransferase n=1 Tax=Acuticoccus sp. MNP-M23 TaxID=3072793 RepID=UPI0028162D09|nr:glycosyltransferase [Acuticoccus sp. MNP-M23]WMS40836.1 glycosyltransferase [Acuticoccus sp. MNP-M23]
MKVVFASHGSLGDLVPFLEIGKVLREGGHRVVVATHDAHRGAVEGAGLIHAPMRPDRPSDATFHARFMHRTRGPAFAYREYLVPAIAQSDADLMAACADANVLVSVTLALAAPLVAARTGIPWLSSAFQPAMLFSAEDPPRLPMLPFIKGRPSYNAWLLKSARKGIESWVAPLRAYRRAEGLGEYPDHPVFSGQHSPDGVLALYSPLLGGLPADAPPGTVQTGQVLQTGAAPLAPDIEAFLGNGPPPIVFTLGSASAHAARRFFVHSAAHARRLGKRALLLVGRPENSAGLPLGPDLMAAAVAPYQSVFPRASLVVHQGGIGTIALAIAAGTPMVLVPFSHDQPDNSARAVRAGVARVVPRWAYGGRGGAAIAAVLADRMMARTIRTAAPQIVAESGATVAAARILAAAQ